MDGCVKYGWLNGWLSRGCWMDALSRVGCVWMGA